MARVSTTVAIEGVRAAHGHQGARGGHFPQWRGGMGSTCSLTKTGQVKCYACGGTGHLARDCASSRGNTRGGFRGGPRGGYRGAQGCSQGQGGDVHVTLRSTVRPPSGKDTGIQSDDSGLVTFVSPE